MYIYNFGKGYKMSIKCNCCEEEKDAKEFDNSIYQRICSKCYVSRKYKKLKKEDIY